MTEKEKAAAGFLYNANYDPDILAEIQKCTDLYFEYNQIKPSDMKTRDEKLKTIIGSVGKDVIVTPPFWCNYGYNVTIPSNVIAVGIPCRVVREIPEADKEKYPTYCGEWVPYSN